MLLSLFPKSVFAHFSHYAFPFICGRRKNNVRAKSLFREIITFRIRYEKNYSVIGR